MCVVLVPKEDGAGGWKELGRTEIIWDNLNPKFVKSFRMEYHFEKVQKLLFQIYDIEHEHGPLSKQDFIGSMVLSALLIMIPYIFV